MNISQIYIALSVVALAAIAILVFFVNRGRSATRLTPLASLAFAFVLAGILFGENRLIGYGLIGAGVLFALVDILAKTRTR
jgi:hypothetical protein